MPETAGDDLFIKRWSLDKDHWQIRITRNGEIILEEHVPIDQENERLLKMLQRIAEKGFEANHVYIPLWSNYQDVIPSIFPKARVFIDYNE